jgi:hypothetical protein
LILKLFDRSERVEDAAVQSSSFRTRRVRAMDHLGMAPAIAAGPYPWCGLIVRGLAGRPGADPGYQHRPIAHRVPTESATGWWKFVRSAPDPD